MSQMPGNIGQNGSGSFDLMQMQLGNLGGMGQYNLPSMMPF